MDGRHTTLFEYFVEIRDLFFPYCPGKAFRLCDTDGYWQRLKGNETDLIGWSNYTPCFPKPVQDLFKVVNKNHQVGLI